MRIELNAGGLGGAAAISGFHTDFSGLISKSKKALSVFQIVRQQSYNMNGGIGNLQGAVNEIETRIFAEETKVTAIETVEKKTNNFLELAIRTDIQTSIKVNKNKNEFYRVNPWAKPPDPPEEKKWYQKAGEWVGGWICQKGQQIAEGINSIKNAAVNWGKSVADTISKAWNSAVEWCKANKDFLKQVAIEIAIGAAVIGLAVLTGGTSLAVTVAIAAGTGAALGGVGNAIEYYAENKTLKGAGKRIIGGMAEGFMTGAISGYVGGQVGIMGKSMNLSRKATTVVGAFSNSVASITGDTIHAVSDGDGISAEEKKSIIKSGITSFITGGFGAYKGYGKETTLDRMRANDAFTKKTTESIKKDAIRNMKNGIPNSIYNAQEAIRDLTAFNKYLLKGIAKEQVVENTVDGVRDMVLKFVKAF